MARLRILTLVSLVLAGLIFTFRKGENATFASGAGLVIEPGWLVPKEDSPIEPRDKRPADQTFLTYPEWFLVHSPAEQAEYFKFNTATTFPFMTHIAQFWDSYAIVSDQIKDNFEYNSGYHFMIKVIGTSATVEYALKAWYETIVGRLTNPDGNQPMTSEDRFNYRYTQAYVDFIREIPWYEFDFKSQLGHLWTETDFWGPHFLRKIERKYLLTSELLVKAAYAKMIKLGTQAIYEEALLTSVVIVDKEPLLADPAIKTLQVFSDASAMLRVPRYAAFNPTAMKLARAGVSFREIAGNNSAILLTVLTKADARLKIEKCTILFEQIIPSRKNAKRVALVTTVPELHRVLLKLAGGQVTIEHIYDY